MSNNCKISNKLNFISPSHIGYNSAITLEVLKPQGVNQYGLTNIIQMQVADLKLALQIYNNKKGDIPQSKFIFTLGKSVQTAKI